MFMCVNVKESSIPQAVWLMRNTIHLCALLCIFRQKLMGGKHPLQVLCLHVLFGVDRSD